MELFRGLRRSPRWLWYRSRLGLPAVVVAVLGALALAGAFVPEDPWYERAQPAEIDGLRRVALAPPSDVPSQPASPPARRVHESMLVDATGARLVAERLRFSTRIARRRGARSNVSRAIAGGDRLSRAIGSIASS
jgi:hypothetical protein